jgi:hypothetical protein
MVQNSTMRLDHVSYVTSHEQLADTVQRLGSRLGSTFVDGGIHPRFGTRNFTCALKNGQYIEVVCPLDHPATEQTPWGKAVSKKANEGGGWFTWVFSTGDISLIETKFGRKSIQGHRTRPNGSELKWKQIGVKEIMDVPEFPFFIQWLTDDHPSLDGNPTAEILEIVIATPNELKNSWFRTEISHALNSAQISLIEESDEESGVGITRIVLKTTQGVIQLE